MRLHKLCIFVLLAGAARASNVSNEISVNSTQATDTNPRSGSVSDTLSASFDLGETLTLDLAGTLTSQSDSPALPPAPPPPSGSGAVALVNLGLDWEANDNWTFGLTTAWSPESTQFADVPISGNYDGLIRSKASQVAAGADVTYDTSGDSNLEWSFTGGLEATRWNIDQAVPRVTNLATGKTVTSAQVRAAVDQFCQSNPKVKNCGRAVKTALSATPFVLDSQRLSAGVTAIVSKDTDLTLSGDYYHYSEDATQTAYFSLIFNGRGGAGVPVAPLLFTVRPEIAHRFGDFSVKLWVQGGRYVPGTGDSTAGTGLKLQYKFTKTFKMSATLSAQRDVDAQGNETKSGTFALAAGYRF